MQYIESKLLTDLIKHNHDNWFYKRSALSPLLIHFLFISRLIERFLDQYPVVGGHSAEGGWQTSDATDTE